MLPFDQEYRAKLATSAPKTREPETVSSLEAAPGASPPSALTLAAGAPIAGDVVAVLPLLAVEAALPKTVEAGLKVARPS